MPLRRLFHLFYWTSFALLAGILCYLGGLTDTDTFDAYNSLLQTRRVVEQAGFADVAYSPVRGRAMVGIVAVLDSAMTAVAGRLPTVPEYHVVMVAIALGSVALWVLVLTALFGPVVSFLVGSLLLWDAPFLYHSIFIHSDILASGAFAVCMLMLIRFERQLAALSRTRLVWRGIALGACFALAGMTKHQFFWLGPVMLSLFAVRPLWERLRANAPVALLSERLTVIGAAGITFVFVIDVSHRWLAGPEIGFVSHVLMLRAQYYDYQSSWTQSSPWVYAEYLQRFGVAFWGVGVAGALLALFRRGELKASLAKLPPWRAEMIALLGVTTFVFAAITQKFSYREIRYLFPLLPTLLAAGALGAVAVLGLFRSKLAHAAILGLLLVTVVFQVKDSRTTLLTMRDRMDPIDKVERNLFWKYLAASETPCAQVKACRFYTYSYDYEWPQYRYILAKPATVSTCDLPTENAIALRRQLSARIEPDTCYVLPSAYQNEGVPAPVTVQKTLGVNLNMEQALKVFRRENLHAGEQVACEAFGDTFDCYLSRRFFQRPASPLAQAR